MTTTKTTTPVIDAQTTLDMVRQRAVMATLNIRVWTGKITDKAESVKVCASNKAEPKVAKVLKDCLSKDQLREVNTIAKEIRELYDSNTLNSMIHGMRILPASKVMDIGAAAISANEKMKDAVKRTLQEPWSEILDSRRTAMQGLFHEEDYPTVDELPGRFGVTLSIFEIPAADSFAVQLAGDAAAMVSDQLTKSNAAMLESMALETCARLAKPLDSLIDKLTHYEKGDNGKLQRRIHANMLPNLLGVLDSLEGLNVLGNADLDALLTRIRRDLKDVETDVLKVSEAARSNTLAKAKSGRKQLDKIVSDLMPAESSADRLAKIMADLG